MKVIFGGAGTTILGAVTTYLLTRKRDKNHEPEKKEKIASSFKYFSAPDDQQFNKPFYDYLIGKINAAKQQIYVSGEGFGEHSAHMAENYNDAIRRALRRNVRIVRFQTARNTSDLWINMLETTVRDYPSSFELLAMREPTPVQMTSICVIDPELKADCIVEMMITSRAMFGSRPANLAGAAVFIEGDARLAIDLRDGLLAMQTDGSAFRISSAEAVGHYLTSRGYYFAYGSNMSMKQMSERVPGAKKMGIGFINNHVLVFNRKGTYREGGVASIVGAPTEKVWGVIWSLSKTDMEKLDLIEDPNAYRPIYIDIQTNSGGTCRARAYQAIPEGPIEPDREYLEVIIDAAREAGLPSEYIRFLENFRKVQT